jgi:hypothetical protein
MIDMNKMLYNVFCPHCNSDYDKEMTINELKEEVCVNCKFKDIIPVKKIHNVIIISKFTKCSHCGNNAYYKSSGLCAKCYHEVNVAKFKCNMCKNSHKENELEEDFSCPTPGCGDSIYWEDNLILASFRYA